MNLRWIIRNGKMILQANYNSNNDGQCVAGHERWEDVPTVPVHKKPEQQKPRTIADNIRDGAYSDWSRQEPEKKAACDNCLKKDSKPREFTIILNVDGTKTAYSDHHEPAKGFEDSVFHVTEVPKGYKLISKMQMLDSWDDSKLWDDRYGSPFDKFLHLIGFSDV